MPTKAKTDRLVGKADYPDHAVKKFDDTNDSPM
jgi:hypothetical protein